MGLGTAAVRLGTGLVILCALLLAAALLLGRTLPPADTFAFVGSQQGETGALVVMDAARGVRYPSLPGITQAAWTPDGRLLFTRAGTLYLRTVAGIQIVSSADYAIASVSWSPDGRYAAMGGTFRSRTRLTLWVVNVQTADVHLLARSGITPAWSPDGTRIAYVSRVSGSYEIYVVRVGSDGRALGVPLNLTNDPAEDYDPAWSPDGTRLAFASNRFNSGYAEIYTMNADGTDVQRRTFSLGVVSNRQPVWSPDGTALLFVSGISGGNNDLYILRLENNTLVRLPLARSVRWSSPVWLTGAR